MGHIRDKKLWALLQFHYGVGDAIDSQKKTVKILQEKHIPLKSLLQSIEIKKTHFKCKSWQII